MIHQRHDFVAGLGIEVPGRFVSKQDGRIVHQGTGDRDSLALTAGELVRLVHHAWLKVHFAKSFLGAANALF